MDEGGNTHVRQAASHPGASLWILGLILSIVGLNIHTATGSWISVVGNISFLVGLGLEGIWWVRRRKDTADEKAKES